MKQLHPIHRKFMILVAIVLVLLALWVAVAVDMAAGAELTRRPFPQWVCHRLPSGSYLKLKVEHKIELMVYLRHAGDIANWPANVGCPTGAIWHD